MLVLGKFNVMECDLLFSLFLKNIKLYVVVDLMVDVLVDMLVVV